MNTGISAASALTPMVPPFPRRSGIRIAPESIAIPFGQGLGVFVIEALPLRLFLGVLPVPPSHPGFDLLQADILAANKNDTHPAPVAVDLPAIRFGGAVVRQRRQTGLGLFAKRLLFFGSVDAGHPDLVRNLFGVQQGERIAVTDTDDPTRQRLGGCADRDQQEEQQHEQTVMHDRETPGQFDSQNSGTSLWTTAGQVP